MKAGWLHRRSDFLRRWKRNWVVVYTNGDLKYFDSPDELTAEETLVLPVEAQRLLRGAQCDAAPPAGRSPDCLFAIATPDKTCVFCADTSDDRDAWLLTVEEAQRARPSSAPPGHFACRPPAYSGPYAAYPPGAYPSGAYPSGAYPSGAYPAQRVVYVENGCNVPARVIQQPDGNTVVVYEDGRPPYCHRHCCYGCRSCCYGDAAFGFAAGALLFSPFLWWPMWC